MVRSLALSLLVLAALAPAAGAAGGYPTDADTTRMGATAPRVPDRYVALWQRHGTLLLRISRSNGEILAQRTLRSHWRVPAAAQDGTGTGLSADGETLVLASYRTRSFPARVTRFAVVSPRTLRPGTHFRLRGELALDAVSPDGRRLFLTQYRSADPDDYAVRAYDVRRHRLAPKPLVDERKPTEKMTGTPVSRTVSADGRWAYTLYAGGDEAFVHALDTARARAFCVDLDGVSTQQAFKLHLRPAPGRVDVTDATGAVVERMSTRTLRASPPAAARTAGGSSFPWGWAVLAAVVLAAAALAARRYGPGSDAAARRSSSSSTETVP